jgi:glycosyltransferase involved in cell wall biosynthesis
MNVIQIPRRFVRQEWGGTETVVLETAQRLPLYGVSTKIFCPNALASSDEEQIDGVSVQRFDYFYPYLGLKPGAKEALDKKGGNLFSFPLRQALLSEPELDLIHLHTMKRLGGIARQVAHTRKIPYVVSLHGGAFDVPADEVASWTEPTRGALEWGKALGAWVGSNRVLDEAAAILCVGENERKATQARYPKQRVEWLPNGVDTKRFSHGDGAGFRLRHKIAASAFLVLTVARIDPQKNQLLAVRALPELLQREPKLHLLFIGAVTSSAYREELLAEAARLGVASHLTILPGLPPAMIPDAYHAADVFLLPSRHEPFGIVIVEAWAAGLPVVASAVGGVPYLIDEGQTGFLFPSDEQHDLVRALLQVRHLCPERRRELVGTARQLAAQRYDWDRITGQLAKLYGECARKTT